MKSDQTLVENEMLVEKQTLVENQTLVEKQTLVENQMLVVGKADVQEDSLGGGLELNDDRRLSTSITSACVDHLSDFSLRILTVLSSDCSDNFISCSYRDFCNLSSSCVSLISFSSLAIKGGIPTPCSEEGNSVCVCVCEQ